MNPALPESGPPRRILLIEESDACRQRLRTYLQFENVALIEGSGGLDLIEACRVHQPDLILLDATLPGSRGYDLIQILKQDPETSSIPVILLSATPSTLDKARGLDLGAVDFLTKPCDPIELRARVRAALRTKDLQDLLERRAHIDGLTGLGNRLALDERLAAEWATSQRLGTPLGVLIADLDHFKRINDRFGHAKGDLALRLAAKALRATVRVGDFVGRYGGEEFVVIAPDCDLAGAFAVAERYRAEVRALRLPSHGSVITLTTSIGVAATPDPSIKGPADLLFKADRALYLAKAAGRDVVKAWGVDDAARPELVPFKPGSPDLEPTHEPGPSIVNP
ncbi:MAG: diguanylate cyclase [Isosphaeraceae bacterium]